MTKVIICRKWFGQRLIPGAQRTACMICSTALQISPKAMQQKSDGDIMLCNNCGSRALTTMKPERIAAIISNPDFSGSETMSPEARELWQLYKARNS